MSHLLCDGLVDNYRKAIWMVSEIIGHFDEEQWGEEISPLQVPWRIAYHIVDCLDFYFRGDEEYEWGHRFDGGWADLHDDEKPTQEDLLAYLNNVEEKILGHFAEIDDDDLGNTYREKNRQRETWLAHYVYALRHTMHHHGALSLLSLSQGNAEGSWA